MLDLPDFPYHPGPTYRPPPKPIRSNMPRNKESSQSTPSTETINPDINLDFEETHHFKKALFLKLITDWTNHSFMNPKN